MKKTKRGGRNKWTADAHFWDFRKRVIRDKEYNYKLWPDASRHEPMGTSYGIFAPEIMGKRVNEYLPTLFVPRFFCHWNCFGGSENKLHVWEQALLHFFRETLEALSRLLVFAALPIFFFHCSQFQNSFWNGFLDLCRLFHYYCLVFVYLFADITSAYCLNPLSSHFLLGPEADCFFRSIQGSSFIFINILAPSLVIGSSRE